jgi:hypothetical protein
MAIQTIYAEYAEHFQNTTGCDPMTFADWLAIDANDRPGVAKVIDTLDENTSRSQWCKAVSAFGFDRCTIDRIECKGGSPIYRITIS